MQQIYNFAFTEQEANVILNALGQRPYIEVAELIAKIHQQADSSMNAEAVDENNESEQEAE